MTVVQPPLGYNLEEKFNCYHKVDKHPLQFLNILMTTRTHNDPTFQNDHIFVLYQSIPTLQTSFEIALNIKLQTITRRPVCQSTLTHFS